MNRRIPLAQSFTVCVPLLTTTRAFGLGRRRWSSPQQCYYCLRTWIAEWLPCWTQAQKGLGSNLRHTVHTHRASVHQAAKLVAALLMVARVTAGLAESNGSLPPGLWLTSPAGWLPRTGISSGTLRSVIEYGLPLPFLPQLTESWTETEIRTYFQN